MKYGSAKGGLTTAGLAYYADGLSGFESKAYIVNSVEKSS